MRSGLLAGGCAGQAMNLELANDIARYAKALTIDMRSRCKREPDIADFAAGFTPLLSGALAACELEKREQLAVWMIQHSFATGHGDTFEDLLKELHWQVFDLRIKALERAAEGK